jgi:O-antigen/teichoic acid export membrane protein
MMTSTFATQTTVLLFGARYAESATVLALLSIGYYANVALGFNTYAAQVYGRLGWIVAFNAGAALMSLVLSLVLVSSWGAEGVALANTLAMITLNLCNQTLFARSSGGPLVPREYLPAYAILIVAAGTLVAVEALSSPSFTLAAAMTGVAWAGVLWSTRRSLRLAESFPELALIPLIRIFIR